MRTVALKGIAGNVRKCPCVHEWNSPSFLNLGLSRDLIFILLFWSIRRTFKAKEDPGNKLEVCLKTDKGNAKLNSWCEKEGTMKLLHEITAGEYFNFPVTFLFLLALCFSQICSMESLKRLFIISYFSFSLRGVAYIHLLYFLSNVEAVPIFPGLFLTPSCAQQYLPLNPFFHLLGVSVSITSPFPSPPPNLLLTLAVPTILWFSQSWHFFPPCWSLTYFPT